MTARQDFIREAVRAGDPDVVQRSLPVWALVYNAAWTRKVFIVLILAVAWQGYALYLDRELMFPTLSVTLTALWDGIVSGGILQRSWASIRVLMMGYAAGLVLAFTFAVLAITSRIGSDFLETLTAMFNPLPAIALLPLAMLWLGLGVESLVFVLVHAVMWPVALNAHAGFRAVSPTVRMVGQNYGLRGLGLVWRILLPAAFPSILSGLKIGWAFGWRTLIAAELVFGVNSGEGGLGWYIFENKNQLEIPEVFAALLMVIVIGLLVENVIFRTIEKNTVHRWGMQH